VRQVALTYDRDMARESCPLPSNSPDESDVVAQMLAATRIAIVGASDAPSRASHQIAAYLLSHGKEVIPVNPNHTVVLNLKCYRSLSEIPGPIDVVNVFRRPEFCADVAREAIAVGAKGLWLQSGITCETSKKLAEDAGIAFVQNRCIMVEHMRRAST
jgi:predicted CoA-binding protein